MAGESFTSTGPAQNGSPEDANCQRVEQWYSQQVEWLRVFAFGILRDNDLVADVLQVVFRKALEQGEGVDPHAVRAWLTRVTHNEAMLIKRKQGVHSRAIQRIGAEKFRAGQGEGDPGQPLEDFIQRETAGQLRAALQQLPVEQRLVVEQRMYADRTFAEIAAELGVPLGTVLTRMRLALGKLRLALHEETTDDKSA